MKLFIYIIIYFAFIGFNIAQITVKDKAVLLTADVSEIDKPFIKLKWNVAKDTATNYFVIFKKNREDKSFSEIARVDSSVFEWIDTNVVIGKSYEYYVENFRSDFSAYGYINAGISLPLKEKRGTFVVFVDNTVYDSLKNEIYRYKTDLEGDGWNVVIDSTIPRAETFDKNKVALVKDKFEKFKKEYPDFSSALLLGRIPVFYTGLITYDGHPEHRGAWPSDLSYGLFGEKWTDTASQTIAIEDRHKNIPGDGKYDQYFHTTDVKIAIGRVDAFNLNYFKKSEIELLRNYLNKNHSFKHKKLTVPDSAIIFNRFGTEYHESFAAMGWMNFSALVSDRISIEHTRETMRTKAFLWMYADGPGNYVGSWDVAYAEDFAAYPMQIAFSALFGSYHGDWDSENNLNRSAIFGEPNGLICIWASRPFWFLHTLGMGELFGEAALLSQNNYANDYPAVSYYYRRGNAITLNGDPSLKLRYISPASNLIAEKVSEKINLSWKAPEDKILGFNLYKRNISFNGEFQRVNENLIVAENYSYSESEIGEFEYMIRVVDLVKSETGTYYDMSQGIFSNKISNHNFDVNKNFDAEITPNPASERVRIFVYSKKPTNLNVQIFDLSGKLVFSKEKQIFNEIDFIDWNCVDRESNSVSQGVYIAKILSEFGEITKKIIHSR